MRVVTSTFWRRKVDNISISFEHVYFLNGLDRLNIELLQRCLQLLVVNSGALVLLLDLPSGCSLSTSHV